MIKLLTIATILALPFYMMSQQEYSDKQVPYQQIPDYPEAYSGGTVAARLVDGLGFRYYWATEGLRKDDLSYAPNEEARTCLETIEHIYNLSMVIVNACQQKINDRSEPSQELDFDEMRIRTLKNLETARLILSNDGQLEEYKIIFKRGEDTSDYPFWNLINGPIADALWHVGQIVSFRRSSGNPLDSRVSVFTGKIRQ